MRVLKLLLGRNRWHPCLDKDSRTDIAKQLDDALPYLVDQFESLTINEYVPPNLLAKLDAVSNYRHCT